MLPVNETYCVRAAKSGGPYRVSHGKRFENSRPSPSQGPLLVGGGQGGSERWTTERFRQMVPAPDPSAPPRSGTAAQAAGVVTRRRVLPALCATSPKGEVRAGGKNKNVAKPFPAAARDAYPLRISSTWASCAGVLTPMSWVSMGREQTRTCSPRDLRMTGRSVR